MNIIDFIKKNIGTDHNTIIRCLNKANIISYDSEKVFVADENYIYFFAALPKIKKSKEFYSFYKSNYPLMKNKMIFSKDTTLYKNRVVALDTKIGLYLWI